MWMFFYDNGYYGIAPCWGGHHHLWSFEMVEQPQTRDPSVAEMAERLKDLTGDPSIKLDNVIWRSHVTEPRTGIAPQFQAGHFFLAGDAAHIALPVGGQGMNSGIQDALALGWRLAAVLTGQAAESLLNTYATERLPVRQELKKDQLSGMYNLVDPSLLQKIGMNVLGPLLAKTTGAVEFQGNRDSAMLNLSYPEGTLVSDELARSGIKAGSRAPDATLAFTGGKVSNYTRYSTVQPIGRPCFSMAKVTMRPDSKPCISSRRYKLYLTCALTPSLEEVTPGSYHRKTVVHGSKRLRCCTIWTISRIKCLIYQRRLLCWFVPMAISGIVVLWRKQVSGSSYKE
ncbi:FAD-dependent monooxygenase [Spirosoma arcticum]